ncbi:MAG: DUF6515 family protein [Deltaproteobacteria bacterium]|jgi:hypothetical protein|nr:DUF6515 family protein [Deltaproteobacteria bacterium]
MLMKKTGLCCLLVILVFLISMGSLLAASGKKYDGRGYDDDGKRGSYGRVKISDNEYKRRGYVLDRRHRHDHYYPRQGAQAKVLPRGYKVVPYRNSRYYFYGGVWYRPSGSRFIVTLPPVGMVVPFLPHAYTTIWVAGFPYYYAAGTYYSWVPESRAYRVVSPPPQAEVVLDPELPDKLFVYPKQGQSEQQQATDRYECHNWARQQTDFDPTQPGGGVDADQNTSKRAEYNRAMKACLEARGYSVQ